MTNKSAILAWLGLSGYLCCICNVGCLIGSLLGSMQVYQRCLGHAWPLLSILIGILSFIAPILGSSMGSSLGSICCLSNLSCLCLVCCSYCSSLNDLFWAVQVMASPTFFIHETLLDGQLEQSEQRKCFLLAVRRQQQHIVPGLHRIPFQVHLFGPIIKQTHECIFFGKT